MASVAEIQILFADLRRDLQAIHDREIEQLQTKQAGMGRGERKADIDDIAAERNQRWRFVQMGLFIGESLIVDIKRIADAMNEPNEYGEIGSAAISGAIVRGLQNR